MLNRTKLLVAFAATAVAVACEDATFVDPNTHFSGALTVAKEVPASTGTGTGTIVVSLTPAGILSYSVTFNGLTGAATAAHIHGPADEATAAGVLINFAALPAAPNGAGQQIALGTNALPNGSASGQVNLKGTATFGTPAISGDSVIALLNNGQLYVNVHTVANTAGEIRAQIKKQ
jgi:hypothetical protein